MPGGRKKIPTGIVISCRKAMRRRFARAAAWRFIRITLLNAPGTIDADYRGEIALIVINHGNAPFVVKRGTRLAQMVVQRICRVQWEETTRLDETPRGAGGFGHT